MPKLCTACHYIGSEKSKVAGSFIGELFLWGMTFFFGIAGFLAFILWIPAAIFLIASLFYSTSRLTGSTKNCPKCGHASMIPVDSPKAKEIITEKKMEVPPDPGIGLKRNDLIFFAVLFIVIFIIYYATK